mgnify:FL=1
MNPTIQTLGQNYPDLEPVLADVQSAYEILVTAYTADHTLYTCGNGGSAADADHIVGELVKGFMLKRPLPAPAQSALVEEHGAAGRFIADHLQGGLPAVALTAHAALTTAFANDVAPELVFAQQINTYGRPGDVLLAISTSGNSTNVLHALRVARTRGVHTLGLTGQTGGQMAALCDVCIKVPFVSTPQIQERHLPIYHALCIAVEAHFFGADA